MTCTADTSPPHPAVSPIVVTDKQVVPHAAKAWEFFRSMGSPKFHVAPMVDQSELPFRMLCRNHGATCAYTPMLHARIFSQDPYYRADTWSTCPGDRPLLVQFCANDPEYLLAAARLVEGQCDGIDINFGCPQRIAKRGNYGAFLMDNLALVERLVRHLSQNLKVPVTCKIRIFPELQTTLAYARMIEAAGCCLLAVHGRTREMKSSTGNLADWDAIKAVKQALSIPVLANGNVRHIQDALECLEYTGCDGIMSAESLLEDPALYAPRRLTPEGAHSWLDGLKLVREYLELVRVHPTPMRMVRGHVHKMAGPWLAEYTDLRDRINTPKPSIDVYIEVFSELHERVMASGRQHPEPKLTPNQLRDLEREQAKKDAIAEQEREQEALDYIERQASSACTGSQCGAQQGADWAANSQAEGEVVYHLFGDHVSTEWVANLEGQQGNTQEAAGQLDKTDCCSG